jgi:hypothetical protein
VSELASELLPQRLREALDRAQRGSAVSVAMSAAAEPSVAAVGVVVPARNEQERIGACLSSVRRALATLPGDVTVAVAVVLDRCTDATADRVAEVLADWPHAVTLSVVDGVVALPAHHVERGSGVVALPRDAPLAGQPGSGVGALRDLGMRHVLHRLRAHPPADTWLLSTDADTTVPVDWVRAHLRFAAEGAHGVAGLADLAGTENLAADAWLRYRAIVDHGLHGDTHRHVYGANLGVRADAYLAVGGFPRDGAGEDHGLWRRLHAAGYALAQPIGIRVRTSARLRGRADDGLADLLRTLHAGDHHLSHQRADHQRGDHHFADHRLGEHCGDRRPDQPDSHRGKPARDGA